MGGWMCGRLNGWMEECHLRGMCKVPKKPRAGLANVSGKEGRSLHGKRTSVLGLKYSSHHALVPLCSFGGFLVTLK